MDSDTEGRLRESLANAQFIGELTFWVTALALLPGGVTWLIAIGLPPLIAWPAGFIAAFVGGVLLAVFAIFSPQTRAASQELYGDDPHRGPQFTPGDMLMGFLMAALVGQFLIGGINAKRPEGPPLLSPPVWLPYIPLTLLIVFILQRFIWWVCRPR